MPQSCARCASCCLSPPSRKAKNSAQVRIAFHTAEVTECLCQSLTAVLINSPQRYLQCWHLYLQRTTHLAGLPVLPSGLWCTGTNLKEYNVMLFCIPKHVISHFAVSIVVFWRVVNDSFLFLLHLVVLPSLSLTSSPCYFLSQENILLPYAAWDRSSVLAARTTKWAKYTKAAAQQDCAVLAHCRELNYTAFTGPLQLQGFYDSMILPNVDNTSLRCRFFLQNLDTKEFGTEALSFQKNYVQNCLLVLN